MTSTPSVQFLATSELGIDISNPESLASLIKSSDINTASLRVSVAVEHAGDVALSAAVWAFCTGLVGRPVELVVGGTRLAPEPMPVSFETWVVEDELTVSPVDPLQPTHIAGAKTLAVVDVDAGDFEYVMLVSLMRKHPISGHWRFPVVTTETAAVDMEEWRRSGEKTRKAISYRNAGDLAPAVPADERRQLLIEAGQIPVEETLTRLGCAQKGTFFQCPRPLGHRTGDQDPSMKTKNGLGQCFVHDKSRVDSLELVMRTAGLGPYDAARFLVAAPDSVWANLAHKIAEERASKLA